MKRQPGFTLVELMVAMSVGIILMVALFSILAASINIWERGRNRLDTFSNARQTLQRISDELTGARAQEDGMQFVENSKDLGSPKPNSSENVFFVAPYPNQAAGDVCVIAYRHNAGERQLERAFVDSARAWAASPRFLADGYKLDGKWAPITKGVIEFEIRPFSEENLDSPAGRAWDSQDKGEKPVMLGKTPRRIVVRLQVVDDRTMARLKDLPVGSPVYQQLINQNVREFYADIALPAS